MATSFTAPSQAAPEAAQLGPSPDDAIVARCLEGDEQAWGTLVEKYKRLVYAIAFRSGLTDDQSNDVFQEVFLELISHLGRLRDPKALPKWLIQTTSHKCFHYHRLRSRQMAGTNEADVESLPDDSGYAPGTDLERWEQEIALSDAIASLPDRCRELVEMLFFTSPPLPYSEVARRLGLAEGSIGFIRGRCLKKLRTNLESAGFSSCA